MYARMKGRDDHDGSALAQFLRTSTQADGHLEYKSPRVFELRPYDRAVPIVTALLRFNDGWSEPLWIREDGSFEVKREFPKPGKYTGTITVTGARIPTLTRTFDRWINSTGWDVRLNTSLKNLQVGEPFKVGGRLDAVGAKLLSGTVDFDDGSGEQDLNIERDASFVLRHLYSAPGKHYPRVTIRDEAGHMATGFPICNVVPRTQSSHLTLLERPR